MRLPCCNSGKLQASPSRLWLPIVSFPFPRLALPSHLRDTYIFHPLSSPTLHPPDIPESSLPCLYNLKSTSQDWDFIEEEVALRTPFSHYFNPRASMHCIYTCVTSLTLFESQIYDIVKWFYQEGGGRFGRLPCCKVESFNPPPLGYGYSSSRSLPRSLCLTSMYSVHLSPPPPPSLRDDFPSFLY